MKDKEVLVVIVGIVAIALVLGSLSVVAMSLSYVPSFKVPAGPGNIEFRAEQPAADAQP